MPDDAPDEDVHSYLERCLVERLGPLGRKVHAGRSRNDQVAVATRLWAKDAARELALAVAGGAGGARRLRARQRGRSCCPATRTCSAPSPCCSATTWPRTRGCSSATPSACARPTRRPTSARSAPARWPARACRSTRSGRPRELGFARSFDNTLDAVADRDFVCDLLYACALGFVHLSRLAEEVDRLHDAGVRVRAARRHDRARLLDDAAEEEPAGRRAPARPRGRRDRPPGGHARRLQGPAAGLRQRPAGGQGARLRAGRGLRRRAAARRRCSSAGLRFDAERMRAAAADGATRGDRRRRGARARRPAVPRGARAGRVAHRRRRALRRADARGGRRRARRARAAPRPGGSRSSSRRSPGASPRRAPGPGRDGARLALAGHGARAGTGRSSSAASLPRSSRARFGTPLYVYDAATLRERARAYVDGVAGHPDAHVSFACKACCTVGVLRLLGECGLGADVASAGELAAALRAGIEPAPHRRARQRQDRRRHRRRAGRRLRPAGARRPRRGRARRGRGRAPRPAPAGGGARHAGHRGRRPREDRDRRTRAPSSASRRPTPRAPASRRARIRGSTGAACTSTSARRSTMPACSRASCAGSASSATRTRSSRA